MKYSNVLAGWILQILTVVICFLPVSELYRRYNDWSWMLFICGVVIITLGSFVKNPRPRPFLPGINMATMSKPPLTPKQYKESKTAFIIGILILVVLGGITAKELFF